MTPRERQARYRERNKQLKLCRQCKNPAARRQDGTPYSACNEHLDSDAERKRNARNAPKEIKST